MLAKNERGYRLNAIKKHFLSLLILLLSVASIRRKWLKMTHTAQPCTVYFLWSKSYFWKNLFLFRVFLIMDTTFLYFSELLKNLSQRNIIFLKIQKYYAIFILYKCVEKLSTTIVCNILNDMFRIKQILLRSKLNDAIFQNLYFGMRHF